MITAWWKHRQMRIALMRLESSVLIEKDITIIGPLNHLTLGKQISFAHNTYLHLGGFEWCDFKGALTIGDKSVFAPNVVIYAAGPFGVHIGQQFDCGPGVKIFASKTNLSNFQSRDFNKVVIGNRVTLFANVVISPGVTIGDDVVVAANSVVTENIPNGAFVGGAPAKIIKHNVRP